MRTELTGPRDKWDMGEQDMGGREENAEENDSDFLFCFCFFTILKCKVKIHKF